MEVTFNISGDIMERLRLEADRCGKTMSALVESALQTSLPEVESTAPQPEPLRKTLPPLPTWKGELLVDISNKEELYRILDEAEDSHLRRLYGYHTEEAPEEREYPL